MPQASRGYALLVIVAGLVTPRGGATGQSSGSDPGPRLRFADDSVELRMHLKGGRSLVEVRIGNAGPYDFLIDTGADISVIDSKIASSLGLEVVGQMAVGAPGGNQIDVDRVVVPAMVVGDMVVEGAKPVTLELAAMTGGIIQGVLGLEVFRNVLLTMDPAAGQAVVSRGSLVRGAPGIVGLDASSGRLKFDMDVAGRRVPTQIDSGSPVGFTLPIDLIDSIPTVSESEQRGTAGLVGGERTIRSRQLDGVVRFGGLEYENPRIDFMDPSPGVANIGSGLLADLVITIDQKNALMAFRRSEQERSQVAGAVQQERSGAPRRLGVRFGGPGGSGLSNVASVDPGSLGERAGFLAGDVIVSLNGLPMSGYDLAALRALIGGTERLRWELERDGVRHVIEIR